VNTRYVMCINNKAYPHDLTLHKVYKVIPDARGQKFGDVRIVDESGEDYLFPEKYFVTITVPAEAEQSFELEAVTAKAE
jgi:hypothetical protein